MPGDARERAGQQDRQKTEVPIYRSIGPFFADFVCREVKIVIEVDGGTHSTADEVARDAARTAYLERSGFRVFRAHNQEVYDNIDGVLDTLLAFIEGKAG